MKSYLKLFIYSLSEKFFSLFEVVHYHSDVWCMFKYRPYSHVHAWLHSTAHPQRKLPIIFFHYPTYFTHVLTLNFQQNIISPNGNCPCCLQQSESVVDKIIEREMFQWPIQKNFILTDSKKFFYFQHAFMFHHMAFLHLLLKLENEIH